MSAAIDGCYMAGAGDETANGRMEIFRRFTADCLSENYGLFFAAQKLSRSNEFRQFERFCGI